MKNYIPFNIDETLCGWMILTRQLVSKELFSVDYFKSTRKSMFFIDFISRILFIFIKIILTFRKGYIQGIIYVDDIEYNRIFHLWNRIPFQEYQSYLSTNVHKKDKETSKKGNKLVILKSFWMNFFLIILIILIVEFMSIHTRDR